MTHSRIYPMDRVDPSDTRMELSCGASRIAVAYIKDRFGLEAAESVAFETRMNLDYIEDRSNWMSFAYWCRLLDKIVTHSHDPMSPYEIGLYAAAHRKFFGPLATFCARSGIVSVVYKVFVQTAPRYGHIAEFNLLELKRNWCRISIRNYVYPQQKNNCLCLQGIMASLPRFFGLPPARINETQCACEGADSCVYEIAWVNKPKEIRRWYGALAGLGLAAVLLAQFGPDAWHAALAALLTLAGYCVGCGQDHKKDAEDARRQREETAASLLESIRDTEQLNEELHARVEQRTGELSESNRKLRQALDDLEANRLKLVEIQSQAMVGALAAGIAHEMNNPLNAIQLFLQGITDDKVCDPEKREMYETMKRSIRRCNRLVREMLLFSRNPNMVAEISLEKAVNEAITLFQKEGPPGINIVRHFAPDMSAMPFLDPSQVRQAVLNLLANASDAMNGHGQIDVSLGVEGQDVVLTVADHGAGMSEEVRRKLFDPLFTTKQNGKGTGLGLAITKQLVVKNNGTIEAFSKEGKGSAFVIRFPANKKMSPHAPPQQSMEENEQHRT